MVFTFLKNIIITFILCQCFIHSSYGYTLPLFNEKLEKKGFIKKQPFTISIGYEYSNTDGFNAISESTTYQRFMLDNIDINKSSNGIKSEAGIYITPFFKIFINYTYRTSKLNIKYNIHKDNNMLLIKDYSDIISKKSEEQIYMAGFETNYEWTIKKYTPYVLLKAGFGLTSSSSYEDMFYNASFTLKAGTYIAFNKNFKLNIYTGADYTTLFNNGLMIENINISIPNEYLMTGISSQDNDITIQYMENYDKNINMMLGAELNIYKYSSIFVEMKYINSFIIFTGIKVMF